MLIMLWSMEESMYSSIHESQNFKAIHIKCHHFSTQKIIQVDWSPLEHLEIVMSFQFVEEF
jgi:hypothetical protein